MSRTLFKSLAVVGLVGLLLLLVPGFALAAGPEGTGPDDALTADGSWAMLEPGEQVWYAFNYDGGESQIGVKMNASPSDGAQFNVTTPDQAQKWRDGGKLDHVGSGSKDQNVGADKSWSGNFNKGGTYYVLVEHTGRRDMPVYYSLSIEGSGVSKPLAAPQPEVAEAVAAVAPVAAAPAEAPAETPSGVGPDSAMTPSADWMELAKGETHWYAINYDGKEGQIKVSLDAEPSQGVKFSVRTPEEVRYWQNTGELKTCGCGTANKYESGDLFWAGGFPVGGVYYIVVEDTGAGAGPSSYALNVSGQGVWF